jgi:salicylate hydroxylase
VFGYPGPISLRRRAWRSILSIENAPAEIRKDDVGLWLGAGCHLVHYPVNNANCLNVVVIGPEAADAPKPLFREGIARRLVDACEVWQTSTLFEVHALRSFANGRIALIGDAAHGMAPSAAQGGAMAIEDAFALALALSKASRVQEGLSEFQRVRRGRISQVMRTSARNLNLYEAQNVPASLRDFSLKLLGTLPATLLLSRLDWLFGR